MLPDFQEIVKTEFQSFLTAFPAFRGKLSKSDKSTRDAWFRVWYVRATIAKRGEQEAVLDILHGLNAGVSRSIS